MKFYLIVANGKKRGMPIPIENDLFVIGSDKACQLRAAYDTVGAQHCAFAVRGNKVFLRDLGSGQATIINGEVMSGSEEWPLHTNDQISVGPLEFRISFREKQLTQHDLEEWALKQLDEDTGPKKSAIEELMQAENASIERDNASDAAGALIDKLSAAKGVVRGRLRITQVGRITVVKINDSFLVDDAELALLRKELHDNLTHPNLRVLIDFKNVRRMSSSAVEFFAAFEKWLRRQGSVLALCRLRPELSAMMKSAQGEDGIRVFADQDAAQKHPW